MTMRVSAALTILGLLSFALPANAGTQDDIEDCRAALTEEGTLKMDEYRLSFEKKKGNSNRVLTLEAIPNAGGAKYIVTCTFKKNKIEAVSVEAAA
ncbi:hypothetical protein [Aquisalinus flavus]|uniref:Uncharacterized protein n=1 Tax=Aquisalinus flavus TaxID=1526572 RepID=A0A8J2Y3K9_9PROT|nr:hypothetical protein [Aquisalinus flavus]MBD0426626.1 hypothetical protein [Aquisalinus flavus]UNE47830.1 hypothetical protein FF099_07090 [Aquisalinus flavus]GGD06373.1 hypothetical protein GCM10011342_14060 [Aquisalinus flavus]